MKESDILIISDYLAHALSAEEQAEVEKRLKTDEDFAVLFGQQETQITILRAASRAETKADLRQQFAQVKQQQAATRRLWLGGSIAAAVIAIFLLIWAPWRSGPDPQQLAMSYLEPFSLVVERGADSSTANLADTAFDLYKKGEFEAALPLLRELHQVKPDDSLITLCLGESLSHTGQYQEAANLFESLTQIGTYRDAAQWRLALNLVLADKSDAAIPVLEKIQQGPHYRQEQAGVLLAQLKKAREN